MDNQAGVDALGVSGTVELGEENTLQPVDGQHLQDLEENQDKTMHELLSGARALPLQVTEAARKYVQECEENDVTPSGGFLSVLSDPQLASCSFALRSHPLVCTLKARFEAWLEVCHVVCVL
jgi:hypothetical protein